MTWENIECYLSQWWGHFYIHQWAPIWQQSQNTFHFSFDFSRHNHWLTHHSIRNNYQAIFSSSSQIKVRRSSFRPSLVYNLYNISYYILDTQDIQRISETSSDVSTIFERPRGRRGKGSSCPGCGHSNSRKFSKSFWKNGQKFQTDDFELT